MSDQISTERWLFKFGGIAAILGSFLAGVGNLFHPVTPRNDPEGVARVIAESQSWTAIHLVIMLGILCMFAGLFAIRHAIQGSVPGKLAHLGLYLAAIGTTLGLVTIILDGVAAKQLANRWAGMTGAEREVALDLVTVNETMNFALAGLFNLSFAGVPFIFFGLAVALSRAYPSWLGWVAAAAGVGSVLAGLYQMMTGVPTITSLILTIIGPSVISLWMLVMGVLLVRNASPLSQSTSFLHRNGAR